MAKINSHAYTVGNHIKTDASCTVYLRYTCVKCDKESGWKPLKLNCSKDSHHNNTEQDIIVSEETMNEAEQTAQDELQAYIDRLAARPENEDRTPIHNYWTNTEPAKCSFCNTIQPWVRFSEEENMKGCGFVFTILSAVGLLLSYIFDWEEFAIICALVGLISIVVFAVGFVYSKKGKAKFAEGKQKFAQWSFDDECPKAD
jgi:magnesium-transporting ATPase (P-type)